MKKILAATTALMLLTALPSLAIAQSKSAPAAASSIKNRVGIAAVVNEDIITFSDINARMGLMLAGAPGAPPDDIRREMETRTLNKLIDEKLQMQEAKSLDIAVTEDQVQAGFAQIAKQNNLESEEFKTRIASQGIQADTLYDQIRAEIAWSQVARRKLRPQINVTESDIDNEIVAIKNRPPEPVAAPATPAGIVATKETGPLVHLKQLVILFEPKDTETIINAKIQRTIALKSEIKNCVDMDAKMQEFKNHGTNDLGIGPLNGLPPPLKNAVKDLKVGQLSNPVRGGNGVAVLMVCQRIEPGQAAEAAPVPAPAPTPVAEAQAPAVTPEAAAETADETQRDEIANKLGLKRLLQLQERYLRDLRATAFIDKRV